MRVRAAGEAARAGIYAASTPRPPDSWNCWARLLVMFSHYSALKGCARRAREGPRAAEGGPGAGASRTRRHSPRGRQSAARGCPAGRRARRQRWPSVPGSGPSPALRPQLLIHTFPPPSLLRRLVSGRGGGAAAGARGQF